MTPTHTTLALDPSAAAIGWAHGTTSGILERAGVYTPQRRQNLDEAADHAALCADARSWLAVTLRHFRPWLVVMEHSGAHNTHRITERLRGALLATCAEHHLCTLFVHPAEWQAWAIRTRIWGPAMKSDEADARCIFHWSAAQRHIIQATENPL